MCEDGPGTRLTVSPSVLPAWGIPTACYYGRERKLLMGPGNGIPTIRASGHPLINSPSNGLCYWPQGLPTYCSSILLNKLTSMSLLTEQLLYLSQNLIVSNPFLSKKLALFLTLNLSDLIHVGLGHWTASFTRPESACFLLFCVPLLCLVPGTDHMGPEPSPFSVSFNIPQNSPYGPVRRNFGHGQEDSTERAVSEWNLLLFHV